MSVRAVGNGSAAFLLTVREAAELLRISFNTTNELGARGETPAMRFGRVIQISCGRLLACIGAQSARGFDTAEPKE